MRAVEQKEEQKQKVPDAPPPPGGPKKSSNETERNLDVVIAVRGRGERDCRIACVLACMHALT